MVDPWCGSENLGRHTSLSPVVCGRVFMDRSATISRSTPVVKRSGMFRPSRRPLVAIAVAAVVGILLLVAGLFLKGHPFDLGAVVALNQVHTGAWGLFADLVYVLVGPAAAVALTVVLAGVVWFISRSFLTAVSFGLIVAVTWLPVAVLKVIVDRPRPEATSLAHAYVPAQVDGSFPSGHTAFVLALAFAAWFLFRETRWRWLVVVLGAAATVIVGVAVVSDGLHYPTDVLASIVWALAMAPAARVIVVDGGAGWLRWRRTLKPVFPSDSPNRAQS
ncbi:phosphatase PAP2 family protein [Streptomyces sp. L7]|uniref:phosphatase PAP2 family protein n=1 Tax=Streptomyces sp. L7 TaxID=3423954 RepID=UPI003D97DF67